ncbi:unnamed protein product [Rotaria sp. Silwood2]|nr:unnamed protein product [Rotaria sp. Silwood2]CAF2541563.1 unnamed protein product [Rotaria sp. Silwood2]CAF2777550.1 unnamed protein product [Rotaria sp. Silwood2]CAF2902469.1 unnamed protein product [Rotaria sp. Silwood2]CAF3981832.1 unnamed protein product [Rotaria sp. Silwood2]
MTTWMFWTFICLALGQLTHSWPAHKQRFRLRTILGTAETIDKPRSSFSEKVRSISNNDEDDDDDLDALHNFDRRGPSNSYQRQVFELTNQARQNGRYCGSTWYPATTTLLWNDQLGYAATNHAKSMLYYNYFSHTGRDGSSFVDRIVAEGYSRNCAGGENIAGNQTPEKTVTAWINSPGHCANLMNKGFKAIGVGYAQGGPYGAYWVQNFGWC